MDEPHPTGLSVDVIDLPSPGGKGDPVGALLAGLRDDTRMVVVSHVLREDGRILDVAGICAALRRRRPDLWILVDGAQALGALPQVEVAALGCDFYVGTPHKTLGSHPVGLLYFGERAYQTLRRRDEWLGSDVRILSGMFDSRLRVRAEGQLSLPEIRSFVAAVDELEARGLVVGGDASALDVHRARLRLAFLNELAQAGEPNCTIDMAAPQSHFIVPLRFPGQDTRAVAERLWRDHWVFVSYIAQNDVLRVSFGPDNTEREVRLAARAVRRACRAAMVAQERLTHRALVERR